MFGYVRPRRDLLDEPALEAYQAAYCGLCRALGKRYGFAARFLVSYDTCFLYLLRSAAAAPAPSVRCWCPARVCGRKPCFSDPEGFAPVAAFTLILCVEKLRDNVRDESLLRGLPYRIAERFFRRAYRRAVREQPAFAGLAAGQLETLHALEEAKSPSIDATADAFAKITAACAGDREDAALRRPMEQVLYQIGRFIYLSDALDDLAGDCKKDAYNPLRFRFSPKDGKLDDTELQYLTQLTDSSVNLAGSALALLPLRQHEKLLENVVYLGLPAVFAAVKAGRFNARDRFRPAKLKKR